MNNIYIRVIVLPCKVYAMTSADENGDYNVYINEALSEEKRTSALYHELRHIICDDFNNGRNIEDVENEANRWAETSRRASQGKGGNSYA